MAYDEYFKLILKASLLRKRIEAKSALVKLFGKIFV